MSEAVLNQVANLLQKSNEIYLNMQNLKWSLESAIKEFEQYKDFYDKGWDAEAIQESIRKQIEEKLDNTKVSEINDLIVKRVYTHVAKRLGESEPKWELRNVIEKRIWRETNEALDEAMKESKVKEDIVKIVELTLKPAVEETLKLAMIKILDTGVKKVVLEELQVQVEALPENVLRRFGYNVKEDP